MALFDGVGGEFNDVVKRNGVLLAHCAILKSTSPGLKEIDLCV